MSSSKSLQKITPEATLAQIISADRQAGEMLASIGLDPAKQEGETLRSVCQQRQWSEVEVLQWIKKHRSADNGISEEENTLEESEVKDDLLECTNYIEDKLLAANLQLLDEISADFSRIHQVHGNQYIWLKAMKWHVEAFEDALGDYFEFEEKTFFDLIKKLRPAKGDILDGTLQKLGRCRHIIENDQQRLRGYMDTIREEGHDFENPEGACTSLRILNQNFKMLYSGLDKQFKMEKEMLLPLVQKKLDGS
jgi:iron-sulfur cluster repair protein YtfE (RIC family)